MITAADIQNYGALAGVAVIALSGLAGLAVKQYYKLRMDIATNQQALAGVEKQQDRHSDDIKALLLNTPSPTQSAPAPAQAAFGGVSAPAPTADVTINNNPPATTDATDPQ